MVGMIKSTIHLRNIRFERAMKYIVNVQLEYVGLDLRISVSGLEICIWKKSSTRQLNKVTLEQVWRKKEKMTKPPRAPDHEKRVEAEETAKRGAATWNCGIMKAVRRGLLREIGIS